MHWSARVECLYNTSTQDRHSPSLIVSQSCISRKHFATVMTLKAKSDFSPLPTSRSASPKQLQERLRRDERFNPPTPSTWKRAALLVLVVFLFWLAFRMRPGKQPQVIHADRCAISGSMTRRLAYSCVPFRTQVLTRTQIPSCSISHYYGDPQRWEDPT